MEGSCAQVMVMVMVMMLVMMRNKMKKIIISKLSRVLVLVVCLPRTNVEDRSVETGLIFRGSY